MWCYTVKTLSTPHRGYTMASRIVVTEDLEEKANNMLASLAASEPESMRPKSASAYLREHAKEIKGLFKKGYTAADIVESLSKTGLSVTTATLHKALLDAGTARNTKKKKKTQVKTTSRTTPKPQDTPLESKRTMVNPNDALNDI